MLITSGSWTVDTSESQWKLDFSCTLLEAQKTRATNLQQILILLLALVIRRYYLNVITKELSSYRRSWRRPALASVQSRTKNSVVQNTDTSL